MTDLQKELNEAFTALSGIPVAGDGVELMAAAKEHLRRAYRAAGVKGGEAADG